MNKRWIRLCWIFGIVLGAVILSLIQPVSTQAQSCDQTLAELRLATSERECRYINTNWACYGHTDAVAVWQQPEQTHNRFSRPRDREQIEVLSGLSTEPSTGAVVMNLEAVPWPLKMMLFGDSTLNPVGETAFLLNADGDALLCEDTPSGLVVRADQAGVLTVNGIDIELGSTAFITTKLLGALGSLTYYSQVDDTWQLMSLTIPELNVDRLTRNEANNLHATWDPTGTRLVFQSDRDGDFDIYTMNADGSGVYQLTHNARSDAHPAWSPDGQWIAFDSNLDGDRDLYRVRPDGSGLEPLTHNQANDRWPVWSPDGSKLAFYSDLDGDREIYVLDLATGQATALTQNPADDRYPAWSPDGNWIAFSSDWDGDWDIYLMDSQGRQIRQLIRNPGVTDWGSTWSPDGRQMAFASDWDGDNEIYLADLETRTVQQLTNNRVNDEMPLWQPAQTARASSGHMEVTNMEGLVTVAVPSQGIRQVVPEGQKVRISPAGDDGVIISEPIPSEVYQSPVVRWITDSPEGLRSVNDPNRNEAIRPCGGTIRYGDTVYEAISVPGQECLYTFTGETGDIVTIAMAEQPTSSSELPEGSEGALDPWLDLRGPDGLVVMTNDDQSSGAYASGIEDFALPFRGVYTIVARSYENDSIGPFVLTLSSRPVLPDLTVTGFEVTGPIDYNEFIEVPVRLTVANVGGGSASDFKVSVDYSSSSGSAARSFGPFVVPFVTPGQSDYYPFVEQPLAAGDEAVLEGVILLSDNLQDETISLVATADSCSGDEFMPDYCRIEEANEQNNQSAPISYRVPIIVQ